MKFFYDIRYAPDQTLPDRAPPNPALPYLALPRLAAPCRTLLNHACFAMPNPTPPCQT